MCLTLEADENMNPTWSIDAAYGVHGDCKGRSGGSFTLGKGSVHTASKRSPQKFQLKLNLWQLMIALNMLYG